MLQAPPARQAQELPEPPDDSPLSLPIQKAGRHCDGRLFRDASSVASRRSACVQIGRESLTLLVRSGLLRRDAAHLLGLVARTGARQSSRHHQLAASERHNNNETGTFLTAGRREADVDRTAVCSARRHFSAKSRAFLSPLRCAIRHRTRRGKPGWTCSAGPRGPDMRVRPSMGSPVAQHCKTMEQPMLKRLHPLSVPRSGGLERRRREHWKHEWLSGSSKRRWGEWCYVLLWRLKPLHPPSIV